jgi:pimeloyl-ACP methyl ester carboxylesterase
VFRSPVHYARRYDSGVAGKIELILLPGLVCDEAVWADQKRALADIADITVADYGLLNTLSAMAGAVLDNAPQRFAVAGHSMGGRVALEIMAQEPGRVTHLGLLDTNYVGLAAGDAGKQEAAGRYARRDVARAEGMRAMSWEWLQGMVHPDRLKDKALTGAIMDMFARKTVGIFEAQTHALLNRRDRRDLLPKIQCPTLVLCGREDAWSTPERHEEMARLIPHAKLSVIEQCGHMCTMERPQEVSAAMRTWLSA